MPAFLHQNLFSVSSTTEWRHFTVAYYAHTGLTVFCGTAYNKSNSSNSQQYYKNKFQVVIVFILLTRVAWRTGFSGNALVFINNVALHVLRPVNTETGNHIHASKLYRYAITTRPGHPFATRRNEYQQGENCQGSAKPPVISSTSNGPFQQHAGGCTC